MYKLTHFVALVVFLLFFIACSDSSLLQSDIDELKQEVEDFKKSNQNLKKRA